MQRSKSSDSPAFLYPRRSRFVNCRSRHDKNARFRNTDGCRNLLTIRHDQTVPTRAQNNQRQLPARHVLLIVQTLVRRHKDIEACPFCCRNQRAVRLSGPALIRPSYDLKLRPEAMT
jgi:hypothetical protein